MVLVFIVASSFFFRVAISPCNMHLERAVDP